MGKKAGITIIIMLMLCTGAFHAWKQYGVQPPDLIRLHVVANSNMFYDQHLKYRVKEHIVQDTAASFSRAADAEEARVISDAEAERIKSIAREEIKNLGYDYPVRVERGTYYFPVKTYTTRQDGELARLTLPPGRYEAVRVVIGSGRGDNWWCVLYPALCFADSGKTVPPAGIPTATAVETIINPGGQANKDARPQIEYRTRAAELWHKIWR